MIVISAGMEKPAKFVVTYQRCMKWLCQMVDAKSTNQSLRSRKRDLFFSAGVDPVTILPEINSAKCAPRIVEYFMGEALRRYRVVAIRHPRFAWLNTGKIGERVDRFSLLC